MLDFFLDSFGGVFALEFGGAKFAGGKVEGGEADALSSLRDGGEKIVFFGAERGIGRCARGDDASDFSPHQLLRHSRVFDLLADGDLEALADQLRDVAFGGVMGDAAHRDGDAFFFVARGERDLQFFGGEDGVVEEEFVEISQAEEQQGAGMLLLDGGILPHQRRGRLGHFNGFAWADYNKAVVPSGCVEISMVCVSFAPSGLARGRQPRLRLGMILHAASRLLAVETAPSSTLITLVGASSQLTRLAPMFSLHPWNCARIRLLARG